MERYRGESYGDQMESQHHYRPSRGGPHSSMRSSSDAPVSHHQHRSPSNYRGERRAFDSPPRFPPGTGGAGVGGFRPAGGGGGGGGYNSGYQMPPVSGQKRAYPFSGRGGSSPEHFDGGSFAKLFVGSVPRTVTEEDIRPLFEEHGRVLEVALIKDKRTGQPQGCCFIKYATPEDADRAIRALHNNYTLQGGTGPIQVRYADGERERLGTIEYKLFVGSLNKQASVKEVEEIFSPYGRVEDVYLMRDEMKQSRGCGFVKYSNRDTALAAINALSGKFTMRGCDQPLTVRFADPKRPRSGESRGPSFGGPGSGPHFQAPGIRPPPTLSEPVHDQIAPNAWRPMAAPNPGPISNASIHGFGNQFPHRSNDVQVSSALGGSSDSSFPVSSTSMSQQGGHSGNGDGSYLGLSVSSSMSQQSLNQPLVQSHSVGPQISPLQKPLPSPQHLPSSLQLQQPVSTPFTQTQNSPALLRQLHQVQMPQSAGQGPVSQAMTSQQPGLHGEFAMTQPQVQQTVPSGLANQQLPNQQSLQHLHQSPSQLAQMLSQQTQTLQASFQSSQQAFSQLQQQLQMMQPSNQNLTTHQGSQAAKQSSWPGTMQPAPAITSFQSPPPTSAAPAAPATSQTIATLKCDWTEHTAPDGYKYYHNSVTGESKWEKPDELTLYEQQQQQQKQTHQTKPSIQQPQMQSYSQVISPQQAPQMQGQYQNPLQIQFRPPQQLQQTSQPSSYQVPGVTGQRSNQEHSYAQLPHVAGSVNDPSRFQQGLQAGQEWMWKNKPAGT
ncbi:PREDICTED: flowering time control protein FCA isoform X1 [Ipomoea nil]|uniref:flowering time control protein FCA isoform X1 n=1 Tax=Ipomoea nil TaxID=35883 RepID=UPI000900B28D|nr:PREDICTED: flowering time control protein FCA isoform X1 [Ipomoea nil]